MPQPLDSLVRQVAELLKQTHARVVFAESCTGGLVSATLARIPGISEFHCGSAVVYRLNTKASWLGIPALMLDNPGPVSHDVASAMADGVLKKTPEACISAAITGHLGPNAPEEQDGLIYIAISRTTSSELVAVRGSEPATNVQVFRHVLPNQISALSHLPGETLREWRQWRATEFVLEHVRDALMCSAQVVCSAQVS